MFYYVFMFLYLNLCMSIGCYQSLDVFGGVDAGGPPSVEGRRYEHKSVGDSCCSFDEGMGVGVVALDQEVALRKGLKFHQLTYIYIL